MPSHLLTVVNCHRSLSEVIEAIELQTHESVPYLDAYTGEIVYVTDEMRDVVEEGQNDGIPQWMREDIPKVRRALYFLLFFPSPCFSRE